MEYQEICSADSRRGLDHFIELNKHFNTNLHKIKISSSRGSSETAQIIKPVWNIRHFAPESVGRWDQFLEVAFDLYRARSHWVLALGGARRYFLEARIRWRALLREGMSIPLARSLGHVVFGAFGFTARLG